jgi:hypothetical protein
LSPHVDVTEQSSELEPVAHAAIEHATAATVVAASPDRTRMGFTFVVRSVRGDLETSTGKGERIHDARGSFQRVRNATRSRGSAIERDRHGHVACDASTRTILRRRWGARE